MELYSTVIQPWTSGNVSEWLMSQIRMKPIIWSASRAQVRILSLSIFLLFSLTTSSWNGLLHHSKGPIIFYFTSISRFFIPPPLEMVEKETASKSPDLWCSPLASFPYAVTVAFLLPELHRAFSRLNNSISTTLTFIFLRRSCWRYQTKYHAA